MTSEADAGASAADELQMEVSRLELRQDDVILNADGTETLQREAAERINGAFGRLVSHGKSAWPVLFANLDNASPSTATAATVGPHTVGEKCYYVLRRQVTSYPRGYPYAKISADSDLDSLWNHDIQTWLEKRSDQTLIEFQIETLRHVIELEREKYDADAAVTERLAEHLELLRAKSNSDEPSDSTERRSRVSENG